MTEPTWDSTDPIAPPAAPVTPGQTNGGAPTWDSTEDLQEKYGTLPQQALAGIEGAGRGVLGPIAPAIERGLDIKPEDIRGRAEANPITHGLGEAAGFAGSMIAGEGIAPAIGKIGELAAHGFEGAGAISKIAASGIRTGAEMAALQTSDEASKLITQDPNQSIGSAAINVGLSGIMGGAGGAVIGSVSPLFKSTMEKIGAPKLIDDAKAQYNFRQSLTNGGDVPAAITDELTTRMNEVDSLKSQMSSLKGESLERAMPEVTEANSEKINAQIQDISSMMAKNIEKAADNAYLKGAVPKLAQDFQDFLEVVTNPEATYASKFDAIDTLKRAQQAKARYNLTAEDTALGSFTKTTARDLRLSLEDTKVWGEAAKVQRDVNAAIKASIDAEKDASSKFTSKILGERVADPTKVNTLVNQTLKGKAGLKTDVVNNYLEHTSKLADTINKIHVDAGLEAPIRLTPTPALDHTLGNSSPGTHLGNWLFDKGLSSVAGHVAGEGIGAGLGSLVGHPIVGAIAGEKLLAPALTSIAKPLLESASHSAAFRGSLEYVASVIKGQKLLNRATESLFKSGAEVLPKDLIPNMTSRMRLEQSIAHNSDPNHAVAIGGDVGHYLPNHTTAAAATAATASNYLNSLKPTQVKNSPLDKPSPIDKSKLSQYHRALDIAQQPLLAIQFAKDGTLKAQDVKTLNTIYPSLHQAMVAKTFEHMTNALSEGKQIPYKQRVSMSLLMGQPLDSTLTPASMQAIIRSNSSKVAQQPQGGGQNHIGKSTANSMQKVNSLYQTPGQARAASRSKL